MRVILAEIAKIFDPFGFLGPIVIAARLILQDYWRQQLTWDQPLPSSILKAWSEYSAEFNNIKNLSFKRGIIPPNISHIQLHGFADASEKAYGACLYLRCTTESGDHHTQLLRARAKVAPLRNVTLARLELCAALLLVNLYETVKEHSHIIIPEAIFWSDSTIVLHWINTPTYQLKTFVANRVAEIQRRTQTTAWRHIRIEDNPADALSRGQSTKTFLKNLIWTTGLSWLQQEESKWPISILSHINEDDKRRKLLCFTTCINLKLLDDTFIKNFNTISSLHRTTAHILRWRKYNNFKGQFSPEEIYPVQLRIFKLIQTIAFSKEIHHLKHSGTQTTLYAVRRRFWPLNGRNEAKRVIYRCIRCIRSKPQTATYLMGELPKERVTQTRSFYHTGVDYCGPFYIKEKKHRNRGKTKIYVAVFICLAVKTVHLEVVTLFFSLIDFY